MIRKSFLGAACLALTAMCWAQAEKPAGPDDKPTPVGVRAPGSDTVAPPRPEAKQQLIPRTADSAPAGDEHVYRVLRGTRVPLRFINSVSTKHSTEGDLIYLETAFPVVADGKVVIPPGSYVQGTVTQVKRPGRVKGRGELYVRFDSLTLPNATARDFRGRINSYDGRDSQTLNKEEGKVVGDSGKGSDVGAIATGASVGASIGAIASRTAGGAGYGALAGAGAAMIGTLFLRGPDAVLERGTVVEMVLDRDLEFPEHELDFSKVFFQRSNDTGPAPAAPQKSGVLNRFPRPF